MDFSIEISIRSCYSLVRMAEEDTNRLTRRELLLGKKEKGVHHDSLPKLEGPIRINNLDLYVLPVDHWRQDYEKHQKLIETAVSQFPIIIPEYFPPEYQSLLDSQNPILGPMFRSYRESNYLFEKVASQCLSENKNVWVLDPAYCGEFAALRAFDLGGTVSLMAGGALMGGLGVFKKLEGKQIDLTEYSLGRVFFGASTRREFLYTLVTLVGFASYAGAFGKSMVGLDLENDFRIRVVAEQLKLLSSVLPPGSKALLIYPPAHWKSIHGLLSDDKTKEQRLGLHLKLKELPFFKPLFLARNYKPTQTGWEQIQTIQI